MEQDGGTPKEDAQNRVRERVDGQQLQELWVGNEARCCMKVKVAVRCQNTYQRIGS